MRANLPPIGSKLPLPVALGNLDGVPGPVASLSELGGGSELLVISMSTESTMSDPLRQTLVGLQEKVVPLGAAAASVSLVPSGNNRKLARKAKVEFPLLSDPGREWLGPLGTLPSGEVALAVVSMPSATVLATLDGSRMKIADMLDATVKLVSQGREALEQAASALAAKKAAAAQAAAEEANAAREAEEAAAAAAQVVAEAKAAEKREADRKAQEELEEANKRLAESLAAANSLKKTGKAAKKAKKTSVASKESKAAKLKAAQKAQKKAKATKVDLLVGEAAPADAEVAATAPVASATALAPPPPKVAPRPPPPPPPPSTQAYDASKIRNFCIIAHIDHGKSTLADRLLQATKAVADREMKDQLLDNMDIERERGITIKLQAARMEYVANDGETYVLNLIDTPGHVDFQYEVSRSLAACEGALLVVDASQGVEAQTIANAYLASELAIVPVLNKIDLQGADPDMVSEEIESTLGIDCSGAIPASAKLGLGVPDILEAIVQRIPPPSGLAAACELPLRALIFDSYYDSYRGVIVFVRVVDGALRKGERIQFAATGAEHEVLEVGTLTPGGERPAEILRAGEVGYVCCGIKSVADARVGDTILPKVSSKATPPEPLPGYREPNPVVYCGLFPVETTQYQLLRESLERLCLNDAALCFEPETSSAMGFGFRCGFLGLLHMEIVQERLEREYDLDLIVTAPSVVYKCQLNDGSEINVDSPAKLVDPEKRESISEPYVELEIFCPKEFSGTLMELCQDRRGEYVDLRFLNDKRCAIKYAIPLAEVITDFFDQMKSKSKGYASMEYSVTGYRPNDLVRLDVLINGEPALPLSAIVHRDDSHTVGKALTRKLKELIPRQQFKVPIQAAIGQKIVASSVISPMRKDVLAKCYGGDISRKKKLLQKQAKGKKRMKMMGSVNVPQEAFMAVLNLKDGS